MGRIGGIKEEWGSGFDSIMAKDIDHLKKELLLALESKDEVLTLDLLKQLGEVENGRVLKYHQAFIRCSLSLFSFLSLLHLSCP